MLGSFFAFLNYIFVECSKNNLIIVKNIQKIKKNKKIIEKTRKMLKFNLDMI